MDKSKYDHLSRDEMEEKLRAYELKFTATKSGPNSTNSRDSNTTQTPPPTPNVNESTFFPPLDDSVDDSVDDSDLMDAVTPGIPLRAPKVILEEKDLKQLNLIASIYFPDMKYDCIEPNGNFMANSFDFEYSKWGVTQLDSDSLPVISDQHPRRIIRKIFGSTGNELENLPRECQYFANEIFERLGQVYPYLVNKPEVSQVAAKFVQEFDPNFTTICNRYFEKYLNDDTKKLDETVKLRNIVQWMTEKILHKFKTRADKLRNLTGVWPNERKTQNPQDANNENGQSEADVGTDQPQQAQPQTLPRLAQDPVAVAQVQFAAKLLDAVGSSKYPYVAQKAVMDQRTERLKLIKVVRAEEAAKRKKDQQVPTGSVNPGNDVEQAQVAEVPTPTQSPSPAPTPTPTQSSAPSQVSTLAPRGRRVGNNKRARTIESARVLRNR